MSANSRPVGVTIVGVLYLIMAILALVAAMGFFLWAGMGHDELVSQPNAPFWLFEGGSLVLTALGLIMFLVAVVDLAVALGCFRGWGWVWSWGLVFAMLNIAMTVLNAIGQDLNLSSIWSLALGLIVPVLIIAYLSTRRVRAFFGKA